LLLKVYYYLLSASGITLYGDRGGGGMSIQMYLENNTTAQLLVTKDNGAWQGTSITAGTNKFYALTGSYYTTS
jgi:hypothetical protein